MNKVKPKLYSTLNAKPKNTLFLALIDPFKEPFQDPL